jgi:methylmalonyl-CoA/ethylmalonyl-CoA epimerase
MNDFGLRFHHLGLASKQYIRTLRFLEDLGYVSGEMIYDELQNVNLWLCDHSAMPTVEVVTPTDSPGPLDSILTEETSFYHVCYETSNLNNSLELIKAKGHRIFCISHRKPAILFKGRNVSFYQIRGFGLVEMLEQE